jgi:dipeptidase
MKRLKIFMMALVMMLTAGSAIKVHACTNVLVSKGASADGSVMISYLADAGGLMDPLHFYPGGEYPE